MDFPQKLRPKDADRTANSVDPDQTRSSLIWVYTVCSDLSVRKLRIIKVDSAHTKSYDLSKKNIECWQA